MDPSSEQLAADCALIEELGGAAKLASRLGFDILAGGIQRVQNWKSRGIPPAVKLQYPDIFLASLMRPELSEPTKEPGHA